MPSHQFQTTVFLMVIHHLRNFLPIIEVRDTKFSDKSDSILSASLTDRDKGEWDFKIVLTKKEKSPIMEVKGLKK